MTVHATYEASVLTAETTKIATIIAADTTFQTTIDAKLSVVGYTLQSGNYANLAAAVASANQARWAARFNAEHAKQVAITSARDTLRNGGDYGPP